MSFDRKIKSSLTCRLCANLITDSILIPLYISIDPDEEPSINRIRKYIDNNILQIKKDDNLPQQICPNCYNKFGVINAFITNVINAQKRLKKYFNSIVVEKIHIEILKSDHSDDEYKNELKESKDDVKIDINLSSELEPSDSESSCSTYFNDDFKEDFRFICHICNFEFETYWKLDKHKSHVHNIKSSNIILCDHCGENISRKSYYRHLKFMDRDVPYDCKYCDEKFTSKRYLCQHYNSKHSNQKDLNTRGYTYACPKCKRKFKSLVYMQKHQIISHNTKREQNPRYKPNTCKYCGQVYGRSDHLQIHIKRVHLNQLDHKCVLCGKCYSQRFQLNRHIKLKHNSNKQSYKCEYCSKSYINEKRYREHVSEHSKEPKFKCVLCNSLFHKKSQLKKHEAVHNKQEERLIQQNEANSLVIESELIDKDELLKFELAEYITE